MKKPTFIKVIIIALSIIIISNDSMMFPQISSLESLFKLGRYYYLNQEYNKTIETMQKLLKGLDKYNKTENIKDLESRIRKLMGWAHLLMGASYEQQDDILQARNQYKLAQPILEKFEIEGLNLSSLLEYGEFITRETREIRELTVVEVESRESKKRKDMNPILKLGIAAVAITSFIILSNIKTKLPEGPAELEVSVEKLFIDPDTGTHWYIEFLFKNVGELLIGIEKISIPTHYSIKETVLFDFKKRMPINDWESYPVQDPLPIAAGGFLAWSGFFSVEDYQGVEKISININYMDVRRRTYIKQIEVELKE